MSRTPGVPEPVSAYPAATSRDLDSWLDADLSRLHPEAQTRLREIADAQAVDTAAWVSIGSLGFLAVFAGVYWSAFSGELQPALGLGLTGGVLAVVCGLLAVRGLSRIPNTERVRIVRGPGSAGGGAIFAVVIYVIFVALTLPMFPAAVEQGGVALAVPVGIHIGMLLLIVATMVVPSVILGSSRPSFRRRVHRNVRLRARLEDDRVTWRPTFGAQMYGPL